MTPNQIYRRNTYIVVILLGLFAAVAGSGCAPSAGGYVARAAARWERATGAVGLPPLPTVREAWGPFRCGLQTATGCYHHETDTITLAVNRPEAEVERTATHEWGHRLGLGHTGRGIMSPKGAYPTSGCITSQDVADVCQVHVCRWEKPECDE
jgi:hypothetical protein